MINQNNIQNINDDEYDIKQFKNIIYEQNIKLLQLNINELQNQLTLHLNQLDNIYNDELYLLNILNFFLNK